MLEDALAFPTTSDDWVQTVVIGGVLSLLGFLILPTIVVSGYLVRVARAGATGGSAPSFTDWGELLVDGLKLLALALAASVVVVVPLAVVAGLGGAVAELTGNRVFAGVVGLVVLLVVAGATLVLGYLLPAAVVNFAVEDSLAAAVDVGTVLDGALTREYATAWLLALLVGFVGATVGGPLTVVIVGIFLVFYTQVVAAYLFGRGFADGLGIDGEAATPAAAAGPSVPSASGGGTSGSGGKGTEEPTTAADTPGSTGSGPDDSADGEGEDAAADAGGEPDAATGPEEGTTDEDPDTADGDDPDTADGDESDAADGDDPDGRESDGAGDR